jgi:uncharacterized protein
MATATFTIYDDLNFFLSHQQKNKPITHSWDWKASIKDMIESLGVPHPEIDLIVVNDNSVDFEYIMQDGDDVHVYPIPYFQTHPLDSKTRIIPEYEGRPRFILDTHLGRLASYLRMMGFDTLYRNDYPDDELAEVSNAEQRILLTRDVGLLKRSLVVHGYYVRNTNPRKRLHEITHRYHLADKIEAFTFCMRCNGQLNSVDKVAILDQIPAKTAEFYTEFHQCDYL